MVLVVRGFGPLMGAQDLANKFAAYGRAYGVDIHPMRLFAQIALPGNDTLADEIITECEHDPLVVRGRIVEVKKGAYWGQKWIDVSQKGKQASQNKKLNPEAIDVTYETVVPETRPEVSELMAKERQSRRAERWEQGHLKSRQAKMNDTVSKAEEMRLEWLAQLDEKLTEGKKAGTQEREEQQAAVTEETEPSIAKT
ncbi:hypothetical protein DENSPDRAFT_59978 [Dentipellis sp. KUC8613]|nr:hypothetical protein DENSPDRAFT_59978 [Dentipellis sp. KUC8613]